MKRYAVIALAIVACLGLADCGSRSKTTTTVSTTTVGQELADLQAAYESGAMSTEEYEKKRKQILARKE